MLAADIVADEEPLNPPQIGREGSKISLTLIRPTHLSQILSLWTETLFFKRDEASLLPESNPLKKYVIFNSDPLPLRSILASVNTHYAATVLLETPYLDLEFWDSFAGFYGTAFSKFERDCARLHFFECTSTEGEALVKAILAGEDEDSLPIQKSKYRGYCVLRPTSSFVVGRSAVVFDARGSSLLPNSVLQVELEKDSRPILTSAHKCNVRICNTSFTFHAPEFMQQDPHLGHCATASLWVANKIVANAFGTGKFRYGAITKRAHGIGEFHRELNIISPPLDERAGLSSNEIKQALLSGGSGYQNTYPHPGENGWKSFSRMAHLIYSYVESGLPVIFCLKSTASNEAEVGHVVASVGHSLPYSSSWLNKKNIKLINKLLQINQRHIPLGSLLGLYYVHDDCYGPYNRLEVIPPLNKLFSKKQNTFKVWLGRKPKPYDLEEIIVPVHPRYRNNPWYSLQDAQANFDYEVEQYRKGHDGDTPIPDNALLVWRSFLVESSRFKNTLKKRLFCEKIRSSYAVLHLPKYVWIHEYTIVTKNSVLDVFPRDGKRLIDGEYIYDATCPNSDMRRLAKRNFLGYYWDYSMGATSNYIVAENADYHECYTRRFHHDVLE